MSEAAGGQCDVPSAASAGGDNPRASDESSSFKGRSSSDTARRLPVEAEPLDMESLGDDEGAAGSGGALPATAAPSRWPAGGMNLALMIAGLLVTVVWSTAPM